MKFTEEEKNILLYLVGGSTTGIKLLKKLERSGIPRNLEYSIIKKLNDTPIDTTPIKVSLFDHRLEVWKDNRVDFEIICSCGQEFYTTTDFFKHQRDWLNKQLNKIGIEVV